MQEGRVALYRQWLVIEDPDNIIKAYTTPENYRANRPVLSAYTWPGINVMIDQATGVGEFTSESLEQTLGDTRFPPPVDVCVSCGEEFPSGELMYDGVEPTVHSGLCHICVIGQAQNIYGPENVILPESWRQ